MAVIPDLELIDSRISGPCKELQGIMKLIRKNITKRDHKVGGGLFFLSFGCLCAGYRCFLL